MVTVWRQDGHCMETVWRLYGDFMEQVWRQYEDSIDSDTSCRDFLVKLIWILSDVLVEKI